MTVPRRSKSHLCRVPRCGRAIKADRFLCQTHWRMVPAAIKDKVFAARERRVKDEGRDLRAAEAEATGAVIVVVAKGGVL